MTTQPTQHDHSPRFFARILDKLPTPHVVVDGAGVVVYGNEQMHRLTGWSVDESVGRNILDSIHPDDVGWIADAFVQLASADQASTELVDQPWTPINFRLVDRSGSIVPVEVTGRGLLDDPDVEGMVYEVRPAREREIFQRVLQGLATGGSLESQFDLIIELVSSSAIRIDSAIVRFGASDRCEVITAVDPELRRVLDDACATDGLAAFRSVEPTPRFQAVPELAGSLADHIDRLGYRDAWHVDTPRLDGDSRSETYRIIAFTDVHHVPARGVIERLTRGAELAAVVSVRARSEQSLDDAAHHDHLTRLPNRLGLERYVSSRHHGDRSDRHPAATLLFIDLDGFKAVNDRCGHAVGDIVLRVVASRLRAVTSTRGVVARFGGDEFAVVLDSTDQQSVSAYVEQVVSTVGQMLVVEGAEITVSASIGMATLDSAADLATAIAEADRVMYEAKRAGADPSTPGTDPDVTIR